MTLIVPELSPLLPAFDSIKSGWALGGLGRRGDPDATGAPYVALDCFASLAMTASRRLTKNRAYFHKGEAEQIRPWPWSGLSTRESSAATPAPQIRSTGLASTRTFSPVCNRWVRSSAFSRELRDVASDHNVEAVRLPFRLHEVFHLAAQCLGGAGAWRGKDARARSIIAEQARFLRHHVVLGRCIADAARFEFAFPPLAQQMQTRRRLGRFRAMPPEAQVARTPAGLDLP